jgi:hypothetical protein
MWADLCRIPMTRTVGKLMSYFVSHVLVWSLYQSADNDYPNYDEG